MLHFINEPFSGLVLSMKGQLQVFKNKRQVPQAATASPQFPLITGTGKSHYPGHSMGERRITDCTHYEHSPGETTPKCTEMAVKSTPLTHPEREKGVVGRVGGKKNEAHPGGADGVGGMLLPQVRLSLLPVVDATAHPPSPCNPLYQDHLHCTHSV